MYADNTLTTSKLFAKNSEAIASIWVRDTTSSKLIRPVITDPIWQPKIAGTKSGPHAKQNIGNRLGRGMETQGSASLPVKAARMLSLYDLLETARLVNPYAHRRRPFC